MRVLVADDDAVSRLLLQTALQRWGYEVSVVSDGTAAMNALTRPAGPRLAVLDWMMPGLDGPTICRRLREIEGADYRYLLLATACSRRSDVVAGLGSGADDYVTKPIDLNELEVRMRAGARILRLQEELVRAREELREQATHDLLTGLLNRGGMRDGLQRMLSRARREGRPMAVLLADLDHFKQVNDRYGHPAGDAVLREAAFRLRKMLRDHDLIGRHGGEEFLVGLDGVSASVTERIAERLRTVLAEAPVTLADGTTVGISGSFGVAMVVPEQDRDGSIAIASADAALYAAKAAGRNRVVMASVASGPLTQEDGHLAEQLRG